MKRDAARPASPPRAALTGEVIVASSTPAGAPIGLRHRQRAGRQPHPQAQHLPQQLQVFVDGVVWLSLEELGQQADLDPLLALLTLPVRPDAVLVASSQQILVRRPDLFPAVQTILLERLPLLTREDLMEISTIPAKDLRHTRVAQEWIEEGRLEGAAQGEAKVMLRQLNRRCGPLSDVTTARIQALPLKQLEALAEALLDFSGSADLEAWLAEHKG